MPIYEYQCEACGHQLEALQKISDAPLKDCPSCHRAALNKLVSAAGFQLKGSGWYATDYSDKKKPKGAGKDGNDVATGSGSTESSGSTEKTKPNDTAAV